MPNLCSDPKAQNVVYRVKVRFQRRIERLKTNQDKVTSCTPHKLQIYCKTCLVGSPVAAAVTSEDVHRTHEESMASDQGILTVSKLSPEIPPCARLNIVWAIGACTYIINSTKDRHCLNLFQF